MKAQEFLDLVDRMMIAQKRYFKNRRQSDLIASKELEKKVVAVVKEGSLEPDTEPSPLSQSKMF